LVVEDDSSVATVTAEMLRILGYSATVASSGASACTAWRESRGAFHLVIIDFVLADSSGADLATIFTDEQPDLPCILISGFSEDNVDLPPGRVKYLAKPFTITQLRETIAALFSK
jgi:DNA-binding NtrC family response regulator